MDGEDVLIGYVHNMCPDRRNKLKTMDYSTFTLQTSSNEVKEALIYSKHKKPLFQESQTSRMPIKLNNYTFTADGKKVVVNDMTYVSFPSPSEYAFQYSEDLPTLKEEHQVTIIQVLNENVEWDIVKIKGKIIQKAQAEKVGVNKLLLSKAVLVDTTGSIQLDLWESNIEKVELGKVYLFTSVQLRVWSNTKKLSTTRGTVITAVEDEALKDIPVQTPDTEQSTTETVVVMEFSAVTKYEKFLMCSKCSKKIRQPTSSTIARCSKCGIIRADKSNKGLSVTVTALTKLGQELHLRFGNEVLTSMLSKGILPGLEEEVLAEKLLFLKPRTVQYNATTSNVVNLGTPVNLETI